MRLLRPLLTSRSGSHRRPFRHEARSPQVRTHSFPAQPPDLRRLALTTRASRLFARSPCSAAPSIRFLFIGSRFRSTLPPHGRSPFRSCASLRSLWSARGGTCTRKSAPMLGAQKKPATRAGLSPYQRRRHGGDRSNYIASHHIRLLYSANVRYSHQEYLNIKARTALAIRAFRSLSCPCPFRWTLCTAGLNITREIIVSSIFLATAKQRFYILLCSLNNGWRMAIIQWRAIGILHALCIRSISLRQPSTF